MDYHIIVAKYKEDISWLEEMDKSHIYLYDKGSTENNLLQGFAHYEQRPNVGRESETYLYHIINNYENDLIIGGHTHTFLKKPVWLKSRFKKPTLINQVGWAGIQLGKIDLHFH